MRTVTVYLLFLFWLPAFAQDISKDTIQLRPVYAGTRIKCEIVKIKTTGEELGSDVLERNSVEVSLIENLPGGYLHSIKFYFNSGLMNLAKKALNIDYKDTQLALVIYDVNEDGTPGKVISDKQIIFTVKERHKGALELDLSPLDIRTHKQLYIGLAAVSNHKEGDVVVKVMKNESATTYYIKRGSTKWIKKGWSSQIKMKLKVEVDAE